MNKPPLPPLFFPGGQPAFHVRNAVAIALQAKGLPSRAADCQPAAHFQAAFSAAQPKQLPSPGIVRQPAAHVQRALEVAQPKSAAPIVTTRQPGQHVRIVLSSAQARFPVANGLASQAPAVSGTTRSPAGSGAVQARPAPPARGVIQRSFEELEARHKKDESKLKFLADCRRIESLLRDSSKVLDYLGEIDTAMGQGSHLKLVLAQKEKEHGFNVEDIPRLGGLLSAEEFSDVLKSGSPFKDRGAPIGHGEWTHRIQWYVIMRHYEDNQASYNFKPIELYTGMTGEEYRFQDITGTTRTLWDLTVDTPRGSNRFTSPEVLVSTLMQAKGKLPHLAAYILRREKKAYQDPDYYAKVEKTPGRRHVGGKPMTPSEYESSKISQE